MKLAILGGSFNPVHNGHLLLADAALGYGYDRVILIPAFQSPFKKDAAGASPDDRLEMLCASISGDPRLTVDACEVRRQGVSYTIDTISDIKKRYCPDGKPGLVLGDDLSDTFYLWRNAPLIADEADILVARRLPPQEGGPDSITDFPYRHADLDNEITDISSRLVREKIQSGHDWHYLVPDGAIEIIEDRGFYGCKSSTKKVRTKIPLSAHGIIVKMENVARETLDLHRFLHSRNTALVARDLCLRFDIDPQAGYLAGITHDLCKSMKDSEIISLVKTDGIKNTDIEKKKPSLLHGRAAAVLLKTHYKIDDEEVLDAVRFHVMGNAKAGHLSKIIYIADKIEFSRHWVEPELRNMRLHAGLDELYSRVFNYTVDNINSRRADSGAHRTDL